MADGNGRPGRSASVFSCGAEQPFDAAFVHGIKRSEFRRQAEAKPGAVNRGLRLQAERAFAPQPRSCPLGLSSVVM